MANMSYCRFQNTLRDLEDCREHITDTQLSKEESRARLDLVELCRDIVAEFEEAEMDEE